jgi:hypothetical protein
MKYLVLLSALYLFSCNTSKHPATSNPEPGLSQLLFDLEYKAIDAEFRLDTGSIAAIMDEGFISINEKEVTTKHEELLGMYDNISKRLKDNHVIDSFYLDQFRVDQFGNTAVVTFFIVTRGQMQNMPFENRRTRFYDVWIKRNGKWKIVSMQATRITK